MITNLVFLNQVATAPLGAANFQAFMFQGSYTKRSFTIFNVNYFVLQLV